MTIRPHSDPVTPDATWRDVPVLGFTVAAGIAVLFCLVWLLRDGLTTDYTWGLLLSPVLMSVPGAAVMVLWERLLARVPRLAATLVAVAALLALGLVLAWWLVEVNAQTHLFTGSTFWLLAVAPVCAGLAWLAHRLLPPARRPVGEPPAALDDDAWARRLAGGPGRSPRSCCSSWPPVSRAWWPGSGSACGTSRTCCSPSSCWCRSGATIGRRCVAPAAEGSQAPAAASTRAT
ncbi:hypothetical protein R0J90_02140 [Micrococcus sp. SIMBA_144]|nr:hypothetical protein [Micrococcus luteus]MCV7714713.1 hypothetical protein [Micrococcus luteus]MDK7176987.1 hypothetical protein [Micrococcus luteus]